MKIAYVCADPGVPVYGWKKGCSIHVQEMVRVLSRLGHDVEIFATNLSNAAPADLASVRIHKLPEPSRDLRRHEREQVAIFSNRALHRELTLAGPFDLVYERYSLWSFAGMRYAKQSNIPGVLEVNSPLIVEQSHYRGLVHLGSAEHVAARCFRDAHAVTAVSTQVADYVHGFPGTDGKVKVLPNGVDPSRFANRWNEPQRVAHPYTVGFVGSLKPWHGVGHLVVAFDALSRRYSHSRLVIVGDGPERKAIENELRSRKLEAATTLTGAVSPADIPSLLEHMDVAVAPYPASENFYFSPLKLYEYMAAGLPVIASAIGQIPELITDEVHGLLCPPGDTAALTEALLCLRNDAALRRRLGSAAREKITKHHTWQQVADQVIAMSVPDTTQFARSVGALGHGAR